MFPLRGNTFETSHTHTGESGQGELEEERNSSAIEAGISNYLGSKFGNELFVTISDVSLAGVFSVHGTFLQPHSKTVGGGLVLNKHKNRR